MLAITVDVEDWYHTPSVTGSPFSRFRDVLEFFSECTERYDYLTESTGRVLFILQQYDIRAAFFIVADVTERYPGLVQQIVAGGHEIACHGLHHACKIHPNDEAATGLPVGIRGENATRQENVGESQRSDSNRVQDPGWLHCRVDD